MSHFSVLQPPAFWAWTLDTRLSQGNTRSPAVGTPENIPITMAGEGDPRRAPGGREDPKQGSPVGGLWPGGSVRNAQCQPTRGSADFT